MNRPGSGAHGDEKMTIRRGKKTTARRGKKATTRREHYAGKWDGFCGATSGRAQAVG